jgi:hypothetical protein
VSVLANLRLQRGESGTALGLFTRAAREEPRVEARWLAVADVAAAAGQPAAALDALERVVRLRGGADEELAKRIEALRARLFGGIALPGRGLGGGAGGVRGAGGASVLDR